MGDCKHIPCISFFVLFIRDSRWGNGERIQCTCRKCGKTIEPNKQIYTKRLSLWVVFFVICVYSFLVRDWLMRAFQMIEHIPKIAATALTALFGSILSLFVVNTLCFVVLHLIRWKESCEEHSE